jgi:hypothetical protein
MSAFRHYRSSSLLCKISVAMICVVVYVLSGTKYASLRLTSLDMELGSLKTHQQPSDGPNNNDNDNECFWYSDNLYHLMCAVLTERPIQFHLFTNRVPKMHRELFRLLDVQRCNVSSASKPLNQKGAGWEDLERNLPQVWNKLYRLHETCQSSRNEHLNSDNNKKKKCLHLARNFNRRLKNCTIPLDQCDTLMFGDALSFCQIWNVAQEYRTIVSPHGFQLVLPILAHAAFASAGQGGIQSHHQQQPQKQEQQPQQPQNGPARIVEVRWPGYGDQSYQELARIFSLHHTLLYGVTPNGKLNNADNECVTIKECRKSERKRDLFCTKDTQQQLEDILDVL